MQSERPVLAKVYIYVVLPLVLIILIAATSWLCRQIWPSDTTLSLLFIGAVLITNGLIIKQGVVWHKQLRS